MSDDDVQSALHQLCPAVLAFQAGPFVLQEELVRLGRVRRVDAAEAVILYCSRILEALAAAALRSVPLETSSNLFSNLDNLRHYSLLDNTTLSWAHALRRIGNAVRHLHQQVQTADAELAILLLERWLAWFFCTFPCGPRLVGLTRDERAFRLADLDELRTLVQMLEELDRHMDMWLHRINEGLPPALVRNAVLPAVLVEMLLERDRYAEARAVLDGAQAVVPHDLRLRQLNGLYWSRTGQLDEARRCLEPLMGQFPDDEETTGIAAGLYKRLWFQDKTQADWLAKAHRAYRRGWVRSRKTNAYLGINAATTALWHGQPAEARRLAADVARLLRQRQDTLQRHAGTLNVELNCWDEITLAEALVLLGGSSPVIRSSRRPRG
jgi:tetratricopeptide (TPR) repeat protein